MTIRPSSESFRRKHQFHHSPENPQQQVRLAWYVNGQSKPTKYLVIFLFYMPVWRVFSFMFRINKI